ncbi:pyridoxamine 5'-phosphate oxidase [Blattabacterium cuenoti]|uniref:pyridoxamine 5'-phosphate oxidase n=1 Tax=Blattabacterium cuenoti TaxID=1653831 RepID=UPI00163C529F|nr:pyridoxamine 5'-phosphate oxidase [Blattabacterium cuenoti]
MNIDLSKYRKNYKHNRLLEYDIPNNPLQLFHNWFDKEKSLYEKYKEINAMSLSTIGKDGCPENRIVLLKEYSNYGFIFYTNYRSNKGKSIYQFPKVCLSFYWNQTERQIIIKGDIQKINRKKSDEYFNRRPKEHKIGCWTSIQSSFLVSKEKLEEQYKKWKIFFIKNKSYIERPFDWGGYIVQPYRMEFWQGQPNRLHERIIYTLKDKNLWEIKRLYP